MRNLYLGGDQRTLKQKIIEAKLALEYNKDHSKRSILTELPQQRPLRHRRRADGRSACRRPRASSSTSPPRSWTSSSPRCSPGLPQAPSQYNPFRDPAAARERRNEVLAKMAELHYITAAAGRRRARRAAGGRDTGTSTPSAARTSSSNTSASSSIHRYGARDRRAGRAEGLHDDRPEHAAARAQSDRGSAQRARRPGLGDRHDQPRTTATSRRWPSPRATSSRSTTSPPTATASRARRSRRSTSPTRSRAGVDPNTTYYLSHTLEPGWLHRLSDLRSQDLRGHLAEQVDQPRAGDARIRQHRLRPAGRRPRRGNGHRKWRTRWASKPTSRATPPRRSAGSRSA